MTNSETKSTSESHSTRMDEQSENPQGESPQSAQKTGEPARCVCGEYTTDHPDVIIHPEYSFTGWFLLSFGVTVSPKRIVYQCKCGRKFAASTDPEVRLRYK